MRRGIDQRIDDLHLLDDRSRPSMGYDQRQRIQFCLDPPPVIFRRPIGRRRLHRGQLYTLRRIGNRFPLRPFDYLRQHPLAKPDPLQPRQFIGEPFNPPG